jgi:hypothetical protein
MGARWDWGWAVAWTLVYGANLFVPLMFGMSATAGGGWVGMGVAVVAIWSAGLVACQRPGRLRMALVIGATAVGLSQVVPFLHIISGMIAIGTWEKVSGDIVGVDIGGDGPGLSESGGFAVTVMTAQPLILIALVFGYAFCWMQGWPSPPAGSLPEDTER